MSFYERKSCRLCGGGDLELGLKLPSTPPANEFRTEPTTQTLYPLEVMVCSTCGHSQLRDVVDPEILFEDYCYVSGTSPTFVKHFEGLANELLNYPTGTNDPPQGGVVVEIGSNDGTFLKAVKKLRPDLNCIGFEPAENLAAMANAAGVRTIPEFFGERACLHLPAQPHLIVANNVMAHIDDLTTVVKTISRVLHPDGQFVFEVQYLGDIMERGQFDNIYHEHCDFHTVKPLIPFMLRYGLQIVDVQRIPTHGGSIRVFTQPIGSKRIGNMENVYNIITEEFLFGYLKPDAWKKVEAKIELARAQLLDFLQHVKSEGKTVVGYGAPAKATTFLYTFGLTKDDLPYIVDDSPLKQGKVSPGLHIPVVSPERLLTDPPNYVLILAWNFADPIIKKYKGQFNFIVPFPEFKVVTP